MLFIFQIKLVFPNISLIYLVLSNYCVYLFTIQFLPLDPTNIFRFTSFTATDFKFFTSNVIM